MSNYTLEERIEQLRPDFEACDCGGSASKPWDYCDDCQTFNVLVDALMDDGDQGFDEAADLELQKGGHI